MLFPVIEVPGCPGFPGGLPRLGESEHLGLVSQYSPRRGFGCVCFICEGALLEGEVGKRKERSKDRVSEQVAVTLGTL